MVKTVWVGRLEHILRWYPNIYNIFGNNKPIYFSPCMHANQFLQTSILPRQLRCRCHRLHHCCGVAFLNNEMARMQQLSSRQNTRVHVSFVRRSGCDARAKGLLIAESSVLPLCPHSIHSASLSGEPPHPPPLQRPRAACGRSGPFGVCPSGYAFRGMPKGMPEGPSGMPAERSGRVYTHTNRHTQIHKVELFLYIYVYIYICVQGRSQRGRGGHGRMLC